MVDSRLLRHFLGAFEHRNMTAAAKALHISQPALTKSIKRLEEELDVRLLERGPGGVEPTRYGHVLARRARLMDLELRHALAEIGAIKDGTGGVLRIGGGPAWSLSILPRAVAEFSRVRRHVMVRLVSGVTNELIPRLLDGELDLGFGALDTPPGPEIGQERLLDFENLVLARSDHPLATGDEIRPEDLLPYPWIAPLHDYATISNLTSFFVQRGLDPPRFAFETTSYGIMLGTLRYSDFLATVASPLLPHAETFGASALPVKGTIRRFPAGVMYRRSTSPAPSADVFVDIVRSVCGDLS